MQRDTFRFLNIFTLLALLAAPAVAETPAPPQQEKKQQATRSEVDLYNAARWRALDRNKDNKLTYEEYLQNGFSFKSDMDKEKLEKAKKYISYAYNLYDTNRDGTVTAEEYNRYHDARFSEIDANNDQVLTRDEIEADEARMQANQKKMAE